MCLCVFISASPFRGTHCKIKKRNPSHSLTFPASVALCKMEYALPVFCLKKAEMNRSSPPSFESVSKIFSKKHSDDQMKLHHYLRGNCNSYRIDKKDVCTTRHRERDCMALYIQNKMC